MPSKYCLFFTGWFLCLTLSLPAQEFNFTVRINYQKRQIVDPKVYEAMETSIREFLNNQRWTEDLFQPEERINCNLLLTIQEEISQTRFNAEIAITATRPVYGSDYETALINHIDKQVTFDYEQFQPIIYTENTYINNLSSILSFYVYIILGFDYDSFSPYGGEPFFQKAQGVLNNVPQAVAAAFGGWQSTDGNRNRFFIIQNILDPRMRDFRRAWYDYHRLGLDVMHNDPAQGQIVILKSLELLDKTNQLFRNTMVLQMFNNAKIEEIIQIFRGAPREIGNQVIQTMSKIDAANLDRYRRIRS